MCPDPFGSSGVALMVVRPVTLQQSSADGANATTSLVFGDAATTTDSSHSTSFDPTSTATSSATPTSTPRNETTPRRRNDDDTGTALGTIKQYNATLPPLNLERLNITSSTSDGNSTNGTSTSGSNSLYGTITYAPSSLSYLELKYGPMGGCHRDENNTRTCTPASLSPSSLSSIGENLASSTTMDTRSLPTSINRVFPILLLTSFITCFVLLLVSIPTLLARTLPTKYASYLSPDSAVQRHLTHVQHYALYVRVILAVLILIPGVGLRMQVSKCVYAFNAANAGKTLPDHTLREEILDSAVSVGIKAYTGQAFGILWASVVLLLIETFVERRRLRREEAVQQARKDIEGQYGRDVFEMVRGGGSKPNVAPEAAASPAPAAQALSASTVPQDEEKARLYRQLQEATQRELQLSRQLDVSKGKRIPVPDWNQPQLQPVYMYHHSPAAAAAPPSEPQHIHNTYDVTMPAFPPLDRAPSYRTTTAAGADVGPRPSHWLYEHNVLQEKLALDLLERERQADFEYRQWVMMGGSAGCGRGGPHAYDREFIRDECGGYDGQDGYAHPLRSQSVPHSRSQTPQPHHLLPPRAQTPLPEYVAPSSAATGGSRRYLHPRAELTTDGSDWSDAEASSGLEEAPSSNARGHQAYQPRAYRAGLVGGGAGSGDGSRRGGPGLARLKYVKA